MPVKHGVASSRLAVSVYCSGGMVRHICVQDGCVKITCKVRILAHGIYHGGGKRVDAYSNKTIYGKYQGFWSYKSTVGMIVMQGDRHSNPCPRYLSAHVGIGIR